jgi:hypothetical protein
MINMRRYPPGSKEPWHEFVRVNQITRKEWDGTFASNKKY